jgi:hypothetical protein
MTIKWQWCRPMSVKANDTPDVKLTIAGQNAALGEYGSRKFNICNK